MDLFTHVTMAYKMKRFIEKNLPVKLNTMAFLWGSIKPDLSPRYFDQPHFRKDSEAFVYREMEQIRKTKLYPTDRCTGQFSERLGVILHYLSDFFCYAHADHFTGGTWTHFLYEMRLALYQTRLLTKMNLAELDRVTVCTSLPSLQTCLDQLHQQYLFSADRPDPATDCLYTYEACLSLCLSLLTLCLANQAVPVETQLEKAVMA